MSNIRLDLMKRQRAQYDWQRMSERQRQERAARFIAANAHACLWVLSLMKFPSSPNVQEAINCGMANAAKEFEETFGLPAPWAKDSVAPTV